MATSGKTRILLSGTLWLASLGGAYLLGTMRNSDGPASGLFFSGAAKHSAQSRRGSPGAGGESGGETASSSAASTASSSSNSEVETGRLTGAGRAAASAKYETRLTRLRAGKSTPDSQRAALNLMAEWAERDPAAALAAASAEPGLKLRADLRATALMHWAKTDPEKAWAFAKENAGGDLPENRFDLLINGLGQGNPETALHFLQDHGEAMGSRLERAAGVVEDLFERGNQEAIIAWAEKLPEGKLKEAAQTRLIDRWGRYDPEAALSWMNAHVSDPKILANTRAELAESWARVSPDAALKWVDSLPADQRSPAIYSRIYGRWIDYDRNAAGAALAAQPASPALDKSIEQYTYEVMRENPADTMPWAESIGDQDRRWRAVERVAEEWRRRDPAGLQKYVRSSGFSDSQKSRLLGGMDGDSGSPAVPGAP